MSEKRELPIQCPECGNMLSTNGIHTVYCNRCIKIFQKKEIRERCGL